MVLVGFCEQEDLRLTRKKETGFAISDDHEGDVLEQLGLGAGDTVPGLFWALDFVAPMSSGH